MTSKKATRTALMLSAIVILLIIAVVALLSFQQIMNAGRTGLQNAVFTLDAPYAR